MLMMRRLTSLATLLRHRGECLEYLRSPKRQLAREVIRSPATPSDLLVEAGTTTEGERSFLAEIVRKSAGEAGPIIEIGTLFGFTTAEMALQKAPDRLLLTVDCFSWNPWGLTSSEHKRLAERVLLIGISRLNVKLIVSDKNAFYKSYAGATPSMVFLDAIHTYEETRKDIEWATGLGCRFIAGHDYSDRFSGVKKAVNEIGSPEIRETVWLVHT